MKVELITACLEILLFIEAGLKLGQREDNGDVERKVIMDGRLHHVLLESAPLIKVPSVHEWTI